MKITKDDVLHVARLARLSLTDEEVRTYTRQMEQILAFMEHLNKADTSGIEPTATIFAASNVTRPDKAENRCNPDEVLGNAPSRKENFFSVPRVIDQE